MIDSAAVRPPEPRTIRAFQRRLLAWYAVHGRDLPWRRTREPYRILVSEIMLQQTQVDRVLPKYRQFLRRFPTLRSLAAADVDEVQQLWYPLGYNIRPVRLHMIARETLAQYRGRLPDDAERLRRLPGVGRYTAGAILSFAYGRDEPVLDTNVRRVLGRVFLGPRRLARTRDRALWDLAGALVPRGRGYDFNQALMDFGATWCTPRRPRCSPCPLGRLCASYPILQEDARIPDDPKAAEGVGPGEPEGLGSARGRIPLTAKRSPRSRDQRSAPSPRRQ